VSTPAGAERMAPLYCPYCGDEDLRPLDAEPGRFGCASCRRAFALRFIGVAPTAG
jgi:transposase-like protein